MLVYNISFYKFKFKNIIFSKFILSNLFLFSVIVCPPFENILSHGADVAIIQNRFFIIWKSLE